jgi:hypothetical protein
MTLTNELPSWRDGAARGAVTDFVARVCRDGSPEFVPPPVRIAVFDNEGTLCSEQPFYFQGLFAFKRVRALSAEHPEWRSTQPFRSVLDKDRQTLEGTAQSGC